jgi:hypothetical protein
MEIPRTHINMILDASVGPDSSMTARSKSQYYQCCLDLGYILVLGGIERNSMTSLGEVSIAHHIPKQSEEHRLTQRILHWFTRHPKI